MNRNSQIIRTSWLGIVANVFLAGFKAAAIATLDQAESTKLIDEYINTADDIERRYYASLLGNVITRLIPAKYSYNEFKAAGINGFIECKNAIIKNVRHKKEDIKPYGNTGRTFSLAKRLTDVDEALRFVLLLFQTGFPLQYKGHQIVTNDGKLSILTSCV